jgi:pimeloyl-ACP methyl ester carboxylesterase
MTGGLQMPAEITATATDLAFEESSVALENGSVRVLQAGQGEPLVLVPGSDGLHLSRGHALLAGMCHAIALDIPGASQRSTQERAGMVLDVLDRQGLEHVSLLGSSSAAADAVELSRQRPDYVRALILESPRGDVAFEQQLSGLTQPTLILCGTRDTLVSPATGRHYSASIPRCHFILVYDAGHVPSRDRPEAFAEVAGDYVQRLEAFVVQRESGMIHP